MILFELLLQRFIVHKPQFYTHQITAEHHRIDMHNRRRAYRIKTQKHESSDFPLAYESSVANVIIDKCDKCTQQLQRNNVKAAKDLIAGLEKDASLLHVMNGDYARLMSLIYNMKAGYCRKMGNDAEALKWIDSAIAVQKLGNVDTIDIARTLLNKSVILGQIARQNNAYSHQTAISLAKQALEIIRNRPVGKQFIPKEQYKLGEIIIISFHNIATELICLKNEQEGYNLYKKAYDLALRVLGPRHNLTIHVKNIISKYKNDKVQKRRVLTEQPSPEKKVKPLTSLIESRTTKKTNFICDNKKFRDFFKIYGYSKESNSFSQSSANNLTDMKDLEKIKKLYKPTKTNSQKKRQNIRQILQNQKQTDGNRLYASVNNKDRNVIDIQNKEKNISRSGSNKNVDKLQQIDVPLLYAPVRDKQKRQEQKEVQEIDKMKEIENKKMFEKIQKKEQSACNLI